MNNDLNIKEIIQTATARVLERAGFFIKITLAFFVITNLPNLIHKLLISQDPSDKRAMTYTLIISLIANLISLAMMIGIVKITLRLIRKENFSFGTLFDSGDCFIKAIAGGIFYVCLVSFYPIIAYIIGVMLHLPEAILMLMLVISLFPAISTAVRCRYWIFLMIDKSVSPLGSIIASSKMTRPILYKLIGFEVLLIVINLIGLLVFVVGLLFTFPMTSIARTLMYEKLLARTDLTEFGITREQDYTSGTESE